jgi:hypothetical protein
MKPFRVCALHVEDVWALLKAVFTRVNALLERYSFSSKDSSSEEWAEKNEDISTNITNTIEAS